MKKDDFKQYAATLRTKNIQFKAMKKSLDEIKAEVTVLDRTKAILKELGVNEAAVARLLADKAIQVVRLECGERCVDAQPAFILRCD